MEPLILYRVSPNRQGKFSPDAGAGAAEVRLRAGGPDCRNVGQPWQKDQQEDGRWLGAALSGSSTSSLPPP